MDSDYTFSIRFSEVWQIVTTGEHFLFLAVLSGTRMDQKGHLTFISTDNQGVQKVLCKLIGVSKLAWECLLNLVKQHTQQFNPAVDTRAGSIVKKGVDQPSIGAESGLTPPKGLTREDVNYFQQSPSAGYESQVDDNSGYRIKQNKIIVGLLDHLFDHQYNRTSQIITYMEKSSWLNPYRLEKSIQILLFSTRTF